MFLFIWIWNGPHIRKNKQPDKFKFSVQNQRKEIFNAYITMDPNVNGKGIKNNINDIDLSEIFGTQKYFRHMNQRKCMHSNYDWMDFKCYGQQN